ncbi:hypothetical protein ACR57A_004897 [Escherichia coli]|uniref:hypothetical protein n=1 Tax=Escherichia coli TaxID=562 RepID=UPI00210BDB4B|nr:hypothetical protein [Escherichia coli]
MALSDIALKRSVTRSERFFLFCMVSLMVVPNEAAERDSGLLCDTLGRGITGSVDLCIVEMMWSHKPIDKRIYHVDIKGILLKHEKILG